MSNARARSTALLALIALVLTSLVQPVAGAAASAASVLEGTAWQLVKFEGGDGKALVAADRTQYTVAFDAGGALSVRIACNHGRGTWQSDGPSQLAFGPLALTRAMCPADPLQDRLMKDWSFVRSYVLTDGRLFLSLMADGGIYEFEPRS
jgi:para-nitrobenzyl esterase